MTEPSRVRIGDAERDDAVSLLTGHLTAGRLDHDEFDERLGRALTAHTRGELDVLFDDLPGRRPGHQPGASPAPRVPGVDPLPVEALSDDDEPPARWHWWTSSWIFFAALALTIVSRGELGPLVGVAAIWCWWIGPNVAAGVDRREHDLERRRRRELGDR